MDHLPPDLNARLRDGEVILFLGSGASAGAVSADGLRKAPLGTKLGEILAEKFLPGEDYSGQSLTLIGQTVIANVGLEATQAYIADYLGTLKPAEYHYLLRAFRWRMIAGTNYDTVVEQVYEGADDRLQDLKPWVRDRDLIDDARRDPNALLYLKLHGCIRHIKDQQTPLVLTTEQFNSVLDGRKNMFDYFRTVAYEKAVVYVGFAMNDSDILSIETELQELGEARAPHYVVSPNMYPSRKRVFEAKNIVVLDGTFEDFLRAADRAIPQPMRKLAGVVAVSLPIESHLIRPPKDLPLLEPLLQSDYEHVYPGMMLPQESPQEFYKGVCRNFTPIQQGWDVGRNLGEKLLGAASRGLQAPL